MITEKFKLLYKMYETSQAIIEKRDAQDLVNEFMLAFCILSDADSWIIILNDNEKTDLDIITPKTRNHCCKENLVELLPVLFTTNAFEIVDADTIANIFTATTNSAILDYHSGIYSSFELSDNESVILIMLRQSQQGPYTKNDLDDYSVLHQFITIFFNFAFYNKNSEDFIEKLSGQLRRQHKWMEALGWINQTEFDVTEQQSTQEFFKGLIFQLSTLMHADGGAMFEVEEGSQQLTPFAHNEGSINLEEIIQIIAKVIRNNEFDKQSLWSKTASEGACLNELGLSHLVLIPMFVQDELQSVLCFSKKEEYFDQDEQAIGRLFSDGVEKIIERRWFLGTIKSKNITLEKEKEEQKALNRKLQEAQETILKSEKMASIGQLAAGVAHEINNPVGYVSSNLSSLAEYIKDLFEIIDGYKALEATEAMNLPELKAMVKLKDELDFDFIKSDIDDLLNESQEGVTRVKQIVQDLKDFSHADKVVWQWTDIHKGMNSTLNIVANELKYKTDLVKNYGDIPDIECMPSQINQVLMNLFVNAGHAIEERGTLTITTLQKDDNHIQIKVSDTGKGIEKDNLSRIFDPFFTTKEIGKGTGLGLSLSYGIIQKHSGSLTVESEVGVGTTFTIELPIKQNDEAKLAEV